MSCDSGLLVVNSPNYYLIMSLFCFNFLKDSLAGYNILSHLLFFSFALWVYQMTNFWPALFLMRNQMLILLWFPCTWYYLQDFLFSVCMCVCMALNRLWCVWCGSHCAYPTKNLLSSLCVGCCYVANLGCFLLLFLQFFFLPFLPS